MQNIALIGMSGIGKSTIGRRIAMGTRQFFDTDKMIEAKFGSRPLPEILEELGPERFLAIESETVITHEWPKHLPFVIATGGSVIYVDETMELLRSISKVVYLQAPFEVIQKRGSLDGRGIVCRNGSSYQDVYNEREQLYQKWAHATVNADDSVIGVSLSIMREVGN